MADKKLKGKVNEKVGGARAKAGDTIGSEEMEAKGRVQQAKGKAEQAAGKAEDKAKDVKDKFS